MITFQNLSTRHKQVLNCRILSIKGDSVVISFIDTKELAFLEPFSNNSVYCEGSICIAFRTAPLIDLYDMNNIIVKYFAQ